MTLLGHTLRHSADKRQQRGVALPLVAVAMLAMLALAGLALDASHALANKTRLQNTADAAALAAAKEYDQSADIVLANLAAMDVFGLNADGAGNHELDAAFEADEISVVIQWSDSLDPFVNIGVGPYVRVMATGYQINTSLTAILGVTDIDIAASAVAGPSPNIIQACNIAPLVACAMDPDDALFGFAENEVQVLKSAAGGSSTLGPGNFQLIRLEDSTGGDDIRFNLAGSYNGCATNGEPVETEPGNTVGPVADGLNTRFGNWHGTMKGTEDDYPSDVITKQPGWPGNDWPLEVQEDNPNTKDINEGDNPNTPEVVEEYHVVQDRNGVLYRFPGDTIDYGYAEYMAHRATPSQFDEFPQPLGHGQHGRRIMALPVAECDGTCSGNCDLPVIGFACFFMLQEMPRTGVEANIFGQFVKDCAAGGVAGPDPGTGPGIYLIQLYKDVKSADS